MLRGYVDEHLSNALVHALRQRNMDVVTPRELGHDGWDDEKLLQYATAERRLMLTCDKDFLRIHASSMRAGRSHRGIVFWKKDDHTFGQTVWKIMEVAIETSSDDAINLLHYL